MSWGLVQISDLHFCATPRRANLWKYVKLRLEETHKDARRLTSEVAPVIFLPESHCPELAEFLARKIFSIRDQIDLLLISGDIATTGLTEDLNIGLGYVANPQVNLHFGADGNASLRSDAFRILLMPGNHDRFRNTSGESGCRTFDLTFDEYWGESDPEISAAILTGSDEDPLSVIVADFSLRSDQDSTVPNRWMRYGQGFAYPDIVEKMVTKTAQVRKKWERSGVIWVTHFPPSEDGGFFGYRQLRYFERVVDAAISNDIKLILAGHIHERKTIELSDLKIICAGSGCLFAEKRGNWLHKLEIEVKNGIATLANKTDYHWVEAQGDFVV